MSIFNRINLETPESVELEFTLAGIGNRAYGLAIDYLFLGFALILSLILFVFLSDRVSRLNLLIEDRDNIIKWLWAIEILIIFVIYVGYFVFFETVWQGQTPGKRKVNTRVIADNGRRVTLAKSALRALLRPIDDLLFIGVFLIILNTREKRIGDLIAGTLVIQEESSQKSYKITTTETATNLAETISQDSDLDLLSPENFAIIRNYLYRRLKMSPQAKKEVARKLALQAKEIIELPEIPEDTTANLFLEAIYLAYKNNKL